MHKNITIAANVTARAMSMLLSAMLDEAKVFASLRKEKITNTGMNSNVCNNVKIPKTVNLSG
jgi:hypothetical protein